MSKESYERAHSDMVSAVDKVYHSGKDDPLDLDKFYETYGNFVRELRKEEDRLPVWPTILTCGLGLLTCGLVLVILCLWS